MSLKDIQKDVDEWAQQFDPPYWKPHEIMARMTEELGELAREVNDRFGPKKKKSAEDLKEIGDELSDIIFTVCCMANSQGIDLQEAWEKVMKEKHWGRDNQRFQRKE